MSQIAWQSALDGHTGYMEQTLFSWENWDSINPLNMIFYNIVLKSDIGPFKCGQKVESVQINYQTSTIFISDDPEGENGYKGKLFWGVYDIEKSQT